MINGEYMSDRKIETIRIEIDISISDAVLLGNIIRDGSKYDVSLMEQSRVKQIAIDAVEESLEFEYQF